MGNGTIGTTGVRETTIKEFAVGRTLASGIWIGVRLTARPGAGGSLDAGVTLSGPELRALADACLRAAEYLEDAI